MSNFSVLNKICVFALCITQTSALGPNLFPAVLPSSLLPTVSPTASLPEYSYTFKPETLLSTTQLIQYWGYPVEVHTVTTQDGYILTAHRIPHGRNRTADPNLLPIMLVHGVFGYSDNFLCNTPYNSLAYLLADDGFDVWIANQRGTEHSKGHKTLSPMGEAYWQFSWDEIAEYDVTAFIDLILSETGKSQIYYSGHSLGGALIFAMLSVRPEYMPKIKEIHALAPVGNFAGINPALKSLASAMPGVRASTEDFKIYEFPKIPPKTAAYAGKYFPVPAREITFFFLGRDDAQWDSSRTEVNLAHIESSMCLNVLYHLAEIANTNEFKKYDWGKIENLRRYGQEYPPFYNLSGITVPSYFYYGSNDLLCSEKNVQFLKNSIAVGFGIFLEAGTGWNHIDFLWGKSAGEVLFKPMITGIKSR